MTLHDESPLATERVTTSRRAPLAVLLVVFALVALFIWKPWSGAAAPLPSPTRVAARPTASPTVAPTPSPAPTPTPGPSAVANVDANWINPFVKCGYQPGQHGASLLSTITLWPPLVILHAVGIGEPVDRVRWRALVQSNLEETLSAPWDRVTASPWRAAPYRADITPTPEAIVIEYSKGPVGPTVVVRVEIVVEWLDPAGQVRGSQSVVPTSRHGDVPGAVLPEGCHAKI